MRFWATDLAPDCSRHLGRWIEPELLQ
uniref:Uncharacterized protein n=1 Tax=Triticum urartu TaxID=4572 RepID=A0A8R7QFC4_TRIUA